MLAFLRVIAHSPGVVIGGRRGPLGPGGRLELIGRTYVGIEPGLDIYVRGAILGGHKNCILDRDPDGNWNLQHAGHAIRIRINGDAFNDSQPRPLAHGDIIEPMCPDGKIVRFVFEQE